jgi:hypothetical protein
MRVAVTMASARSAKLGRLCWTRHSWFWLLGWLGQIGVPLIFAGILLSRCSRWTSSAHGAGFWLRSRKLSGSAEGKQCKCGVTLVRFGTHLGWRWPDHRKWNKSPHIRVPIDGELVTNYLALPFGQIHISTDQDERRATIFRLPYIIAHSVAAQRVRRLCGYVYPGFVLSTFWRIDSGNYYSALRSSPSPSNYRNILRCRMAYVAKKNERTTITFLDFSKRRERPVFPTYRDTSTFGHVLQPILFKSDVAQNGGESYQQKVEKILGGYVFTEPSGYSSDPEEWLPQQPEKSDEPLFHWLLVVACLLISGCGIVINGKGYGIDAFLAIGAWSGLVWTLCRFFNFRRFCWCFEVIPTFSGSTLTKALGASWNVNGCSDTGFALGMT